MERIKVLVIAPYDSLRDIILQTATQFEQIDVEIYIGDLSRGVSFVQQEFNQHFDFIVSRGGTGEMIEKITDTPVVNIEISGYDMLHVIRLSQNYAGHSAIVGFKNITNHAKRLCDLLQYKTDIFTVSTEQEIYDRLTTLRQEGYSLIIGDSRTISTARELGLTGILLTSGKESVEHAFAQVVYLHHIQHSKDMQISLFHEIVESSGSHVAVFDKAEHCRYQSFSSADTAVFSLYNDLKEQISSIRHQKGATFLKKYRSTLWKIKCVVVEREGGPYCICYFSPSINLTHMEEPLFHVKNPLAENVGFCAAYFDTSEYIKKVYEGAKKFAKASSPLMISGEIGTGKDMIANYIHMNSSKRSHPFLTINCELLTEKSWHSLFAMEDSPLNDSDYTVYIKNLHLLSKPLQKRLDLYMEHSFFHKRHRILSSTNTDLAYMAKCGDFNWSLYKKLSVLSLSLLPLRERKEEIASIASIIISRLNLKYAKQIIGPDDKSLQLLQDFPWDFNIDQLKSVLNELALLSTGPYILGEDTAFVLRNIPRTAIREGDVNFDLTKTLDEINKDIINFVLNLENQNQSKASKRLGISRSTMWRKLK